MKPITCFKAYDLRGRIPDELNEDVAYAVGRGYARFLSPQRVVVGRDIRLSSAGLADALCRGLTDSGVDVYDIGVCGTEGCTSPPSTAAMTAASWSRPATIPPITTA